MVIFVSAASAAAVKVNDCDDKSGNNNMHNNNILGSTPTAIQNSLLKQCMNEASLPFWKDSYSENALSLFPLSQSIGQPLILYRRMGKLFSI
jgi:hypothetical protein